MLGAFSRWVPPAQVAQAVLATCSEVQAACDHPRGKGGAASLREEAEDGNKWINPPQESSPAAVVNDAHLPFSNPLQEPQAAKQQPHFPQNHTIWPMQGQGRSAATRQSATTN